MKKQILIATGNKGKMIELTTLLADIRAEIEWLNLKDLPNLPEAVEDGTTFAENAQKKALHYAKLTGLWTIADDSGLCIDALNGAPGIHSARFSGPKDNHANRSLIDHKNIAKVLELMKNTPADKRTARFVCNMALANPDKILIQTQAEFHGIITTQPAGRNGFGYDPIFFVPDLNITVAQLTAEQKNKISHRANAIKKLKTPLADLLKTSPD